jgi:hypothetical protein
MAPILTRLGTGRGGFGFGRRATSPIYTIIPSVSSLNEGSPVTFTINTINVQSGTTLYWTINSVSGTVNSGDFDEGDSGSFVVTGNTGSVVLNVSNDATTEGSESFQLQVRTGSTSGPIVATSAIITIGDTSLTPTYSVSPSTSSVNEGSSVTFTTTTTNVPDSTTLYWTLSTISGTINTSDFSGGATSGSFTITSNSGSVVLTLANDVTTEGSESFQFQVRTGSTGGTIVDTSTTVTINDTSPGLLSATGGTTIDSGGYRIHVFTSPGSFVVSDAGSGTVEYLVVAGGGGGGARHGGGGGAGGYRTGTGLPIIATTYPITIGGGGSGGVGSQSPTIASNPGNPSVFHTITSTGGGGGGGFASPAQNGNPGGSGGGGANQDGAITPASGIPGQGNPGGIAGFGAGSPWAGSGGGGAGAAGSNKISNSIAGPGGVGSPISWLPASYGTVGPAPGRYFAGGGGGGVNGSGGSGGGGAGADGSNNGIPGTGNTGGGGGGSRSNPESYNGGAGGSGIVAIRYPYP